MILLEDDDLPPPVTLRGLWSATACLIGWWRWPLALVAVILLLSPFFA